MYGFVVDYSPIPKNITIQVLGRTALVMAAEGGHVHTVKALITGGADVNIWDRVS